jgi:5-oxoprolinase (ATP-hydrolysing) subunit A
MRTIDLNSDLGEGWGVWPRPSQPWRAAATWQGATDPADGFTLPTDDAILALVSSASIACGGHAGDPWLMDRTVAAALARGVSVGAHPAYADLAGFGLRAMHLPPDELEAVILVQLGGLDALVRRRGGRLRHVKAHGALYNQAETDRGVADALVRAVAAHSKELVLFARAGSAMVEAAQAAGVPVAREAFGDRAYHADGRLVDRRRRDALVTDPAALADRAVRMIEEGRVRSVDGPDVEVAADTICVHADTPNALASLTALREALDRHGIAVMPARTPATSRDHA